MLFVHQTQKRFEDPIVALKQEDNSPHRFARYIVSIIEAFAMSDEVLQVRVAATAERRIVVSAFFLCTRGVGNIYILPTLHWTGDLLVLLHLYLSHDESYSDEVILPAFCLTLDEKSRRIHDCHRGKSRQVHTKIHRDHHERRIREKEGWRRRTGEGCHHQEGSNQRCANCFVCPNTRRCTASPLHTHARRR